MSFTLRAVWLRFPPREINSVLPSEYLEILEPLLEREIDDISVKDDKSLKADIFKGMFIAELGKESNRHRLIDLLTDSEVVELADHLKWPDSVGLREKLKRIAWNAENADAIAFAQAFDIPSHVLKIGKLTKRELPQKVIPWICKLDQLDFPDSKDLAGTLEIEMGQRSPYKILQPDQSRAMQDVADINFALTLLDAY